MIAWTSRPPEARALLNPSFCSVILWHSARGYATEADTPLPLELAFTILPVVLHRETREALPHAVTTSLTVWLDEHPLIRARIAGRARMLLAFTREALMFGGLHGLLALSGGVVTANGARTKAVNAVLKTCNDEVRACAKRAEFTGRWLAKAGTASTVMTLVGVRP